MRPIFVEKRYATLNPADTPPLFLVKLVRNKPRKEGSLGIVIYHLPPPATIAINAHLDATLFRRLS